ncbi:MAG TPA: hydroxymethylbilane synthase [Solirubrobacteraceae bacterium]|nr:hydroxymethylbilane synthase [Solirubrobacteraceae bacterium]
MPLRIGTRGSALALVQARWVAAQLSGDVDAVEVVEITTAGDRGQDVGDKARWVSALEAALLEDRVDVAVHSAKDVPGELAPGTVIAAVPARESSADVLVGARGPRIGTASLRRAAQLRALDPTLEVRELRGNVDTRLRKLDAGEVDGLVLAAAGLDRLGVTRERVVLDLVPAPGQGALALQTRTERAGAVAALSDPDALAAVTAERALASALGASCHTAMGAQARRAGGSDTAELELTGWVGLPDGSEWITDTLVGHPDLVAAELAARMIAVGARELLVRAAALDTGVAQ